MLLIVFLTVFGVSSVIGHYSNVPLIDELDKDVRELKDSQSKMYEHMDRIETNIMEKLSVDDTFETRLSDIEGTVDALKIYLTREKRRDTDLVKRSDKAIRQINQKVTEARDLVANTKVDISKCVSDFEDRLVSVKKSAERNMEVEGVIRYGGVGTSCSAGNDACAVEKSECRHGRCQCEPGYNYNKHTQECTTSCTSYGTTFQSIENRVIRGHNDKILEGVSFPECKKNCTDANDFVCRSIDYFASLQECYLSSVTALEAEDDWEYNSIGYHFQRDCA